MNQETYQNRPTMAKWNELVQAVGCMPKIATGSYSGTGTYGSGNRNTIHIGFVPKIVFLQQSDPGRPGCVSWIYGFPSGVALNDSNAGIVTLVWDGTSLSWYSVNSANDQLNLSGRTYHWVALG